MIAASGCGGGAADDAGADAAVGPRDAGRPDTGVLDAGVPDAAATDAGPADAGVLDAGQRDAGVDAGAPDAFVPAPIAERDGPGAAVASSPVSPACLERTYGGPGYEQFQDLAVLADGGALLGGTTTATLGSYLDAWLIRLDATGDVVWSRAIGAAYRDGFQAVRVASDGDLLAAGFSQVGDGRDGGQSAALLVRVAPSTGLLRWSRRLMPRDAFARAVDVFETASGELRVVVNETEGPSGSWDVAVWRATAEGTTLGVREIDLGAIDEVCAATEMSDGGLLLVGRSFDTFVDDEDTFFALRLDADLREVWRRTYGTNGIGWSAAGERPCGVVRLDGDAAAIATTDRTDPFAQSRRVLVIAADGSPIRDRVHHVAGDHRVQSIARAADGQLVVIGPRIDGSLDFEADRVDDAGDVRWTASYGGADWDLPRSLERVADGSFLVAGETYSLRPDSQGWVLRLTDAGAFTCAW